MNHKKELLRSLWVHPNSENVQSLRLDTQRQSLTMLEVRVFTGMYHGFSLFRKYGNQPFPQGRIFLSRIRAKFQPSRRKRVSDLAFQQ